MPVIIRLLLGLGSLAGFFWGALKLSQHAEKEQFNNGVCKKCGGHFKVIEGTLQAPAKGYQCDTCNNCVWVSEGADIGYEYRPKPIMGENDCCPKCKSMSTHDKETAPPTHVCNECGQEFQDE